METKEKIEQLKKDIKSIREYLNSSERVGGHILDKEAKSFFAYRILKEEQELKQLGEK